MQQQASPKKGEEWLAPNDHVVSRCHGEETLLDKWAIGYFEGAHLRRKNPGQTGDLPISATQEIGESAA
jgi:hypothetical protein